MPRGEQSAVHMCSLVLVCVYLCVCLCVFVFVCLCLSPYVCVCVCVLFASAGIHVVLSVMRRNRI
jgi:Flp pilus assembly protein TadB